MLIMRKKEEDLKERRMQTSSYSIYCVLYLDLFILSHLILLTTSGSKCLHWGKLKKRDKICNSHFAAATAAKSLQPCPTLCDPIDGSPPGSPVPGILQARTLEWVAISFSNA